MTESRCLGWPGASNGYDHRVWAHLSAHGRSHAAPKIGHHYEVREPMREQVGGWEPSTGWPGWTGGLFVRSQDDVRKTSDVIACTAKRHAAWAWAHVGLVSGPGGFEGLNFCLSRVADAQLRRDAREYVAVYGCVRALTAAVVAVTVAVADSGGPSASQMASSSRSQLAVRPASAAQG